MKLSNKKSEIKMSEFDAKAREWDKDKMHLDRSLAIATELEKIIPANHRLKALEYGAGTGILSFMMKDKFSEIVLMDSSMEMLKVCQEKIEFYGTSNISTLFFDLEHSDFHEKFDIIYSQMVLHHVVNTDQILNKFFSMLNPGGILAIADLFPEDGSFHGLGVTNVHLGFDPEKLNEQLRRIGFQHSEYNTCFVVRRPTGVDFPIFFLHAIKGQASKS